MGVLVVLVELYVETKKVGCDCSRKEKMKNYRREESLGLFALRKAIKLLLCISAGSE